MLYALVNKERVLPQPGLKAVCPCCNTGVTAKCGSIKVWHWAHDNLTECDRWSEGMTEWHKMWQDWVPEDCRELVIGPHRADIKLKDVVVELQHSPISPETIKEREDFYKDMVWVFDGKGFEDNFDTTGVTNFSLLKEISIGIDLEYNSMRRVNWKRKKKTILSASKPTFIHFGGTDVFCLLGEDYYSHSIWGYFLTIDDFFEKLLYKKDFNKVFNPWKDYTMQERIELEKKHIQLSMMNTYTRRNHNGTTL